MNRVFKFVVIMFTVIAVVFSTMFGVIAAKKVTEISVGNVISMDSLEKDETVDGLVNILLIGVDEGGFRSDTIMLVSIDGYSNRLNFLSIPRDTKVKVKGYSTCKINALIGLGRQAEKNGKLKEPEELLINTVKDITGLPIHYFLLIDFDGFKDLINSVDGVDFNVPYEMNYDDPVQNLHIHLKPGQQHLDGQAAHDFVRFRHNNNGTAPGEYVMGDEGREYWQQEFLKELFRQKFNAKYIGKLDDLFRVAQSRVRTNYTMKDLLVHLGLIKKVEPSSIGSYQLPGQSEYENDVWWYIQNKEKTNKLVKEIFMPISLEEWEKKKDSPEVLQQEFKVQTGRENTAAPSAVTNLDSQSASE